MSVPLILQLRPWLCAKINRIRFIEEGYNVPRRRYTWALFARLLFLSTFAVYWIINKFYGICSYNLKLIKNNWKSELVECVSWFVPYSIPWLRKPFLFVFYSFFIRFIHFMHFKKSSNVSKFSNIIKYKLYHTLIHMFIFLCLFLKQFSVL